MNPEVVAYVVASVAVAAAGVVSWLARNAVDVVRRELDDHEQRLRLVDHAVARCARSDDLRDLEKRIGADIKDALRELREDMRAMRAALEDRP